MEEKNCINTMEVSQNNDPILQIIILILEIFYGKKETHTDRVQTKTERASVGNIHHWAI